MLPLDFGEDNLDHIEYNKRDGTGYLAHEIILRYSDVSDALAVARERCECGCASSKGQNLREFEILQYNRLNDGCLQTHMFTQIILLIGHALAEAAGAKDISNLRAEESYNSLVHITMRFLVELVQKRHIYWETWFRLAASAITGLPSDLAREDDHNFYNLLFWQAGPITIVPLWFTLDQEISLESSWGVRIVFGSIQGVQSEWAVIAAEDTLEGDDNDEEIPKVEVVCGGSDNESPCDVTYAMFPKSDDLYTLMMMVRTEGSIRALGAVDIYRWLMEAKRPSCTHDSQDQGVSVHPWTFAQVAKKWTTGTYGPYSRIYQNLDDPDPAPHIALLENDWLKSNVAVGFQNTWGFVRERNCCFKCFAHAIREYNKGQETKYTGVWAGSRGRELLITSRDKC